ncbi:MAG TPA: menaquinone biosynthesis protein [Bryobacteraceae bacterium]|nr:menaquinone biosynthesis protein [Bryobacteraceae bacterium]
MRSTNFTARPRVCAVSYLNTVPLIWGLLRSPDEELRSLFDLEFALPSDCSDRLAAGQADIGIVPVIEMARQKLEYFRGAGIACHGPVRSILLISKVPFGKIRTLATDAGSRSSVMLARVILAERFGAEPKLYTQPADLAAMLAHADAALIIGDPALRLDPSTLPLEALDLGGEWNAMTGLPMVFAVWAGKKDAMKPRYERAFNESLRYGIEHALEIAREEAPLRGITEELAGQYLTRHIVYDLGERDYEGMKMYLESALRLERATV